jgi:hypothetical protein
MENPFFLSLMTYSTRHPIVEIWITRLRENTSILLGLPSNCLPLCICTRSCTSPVSFLPLLSIYYQEYQCGRQSNNDEAFYNSIFNKIIVQPVSVASWHGIVGRDIIVVVIVICVVGVVILQEVANPLR